MLLDHAQSLTRKAKTWNQAASRMKARDKVSTQHFCSTTQAPENFATYGVRHTKRYPVPKPTRKMTAPAEAGTAGNSSGS